MTKSKHFAVTCRCPACQAEGGRVEPCQKDVTLVRCLQCNLVYAWPLTTSAALYEKAYRNDGEYHYYLSQLSPIEAGTYHLTWPMRRFLAKFKPNDGKLLDIGCSTGGFLSAAQKSGWQVFGLEISKKAASSARSLTGAEIFVGTFERIGSTARFDAITAWEVAEHVPDVADFVRRAVDLLESGGVLALSVPNWNSPWMRRSERREHWPPFHLTFWSRETLRSFLLGFGLEKVAVREKPFAWEEEVGQLKWLYLPVALLRSALLGQRGMHLYASAIKP